MQRLRRNPRQIHVLQICVLYDFNQLCQTLVVLLEQALPDLLAFAMQGDVNDYSHTVENQVTKGVLQDHTKCLHKLGIVEECIAQFTVSRQVADHSHAFNLDLLIDMRQQVRLHCFENFTSDGVCENVCGLRVVEQHVSRAGNCV